MHTTTITIHWGMLFFDIFTFCQQWLYLPLNLVLLCSKAVAIIVLLYLAVWPLNSLYFGQLARRQAYLVELSFRGAHLVFQLTFRFILWIFIVKMVRRKRGFQDQEKNRHLRPPGKKGVAAGSGLLWLPLTLLTLKITLHILILFSSRPHRPVQDSILPQRSWNFTVTVDHLLTDPTNPQILWHLRRI